MIFRNQRLTPEQYLAFGRRFGALLPRWLRVAVAGGVLAIVAGCELPQGLREDYMFKDWIEPSRAPKMVKHDPYGNAVAPPDERRRR